jgi:misacylated tRNA(Ala) deacylase
MNTAFDARLKYPPDVQSCMTEQTYLEDSSARQFTTTVKRTLSDPPRVVLHRTEFYPEGGGQPADHGTLVANDRELRVTNVQKRDAIYHELDDSAFEVGTTVCGNLDWPRREAHMRYHTAQHLLSALLLEEYDAQTRGNQLYVDRARIDVEHGRFDDTALTAVQTRMNELVSDARPVRWYTMDRETAETTLDTTRTRIDLLPESIDQLRIVEVGHPGGADSGPVEAAPGNMTYDRTACAGTHVANTNLVGTVRVTGRETGGRDRERIHFELEK